MPKFEYRTRWRREGGRISTHITQRHASARRKAIAVLALERLRPEIHGLQLFPALVEPPVIQRREVGEWEDFDHERVEVTDRKLAEMREWAIYRHGDDQQREALDAGDIW